MYMLSNKKPMDSNNIINRYNVGCSARVGLFEGDRKEADAAETTGESSSPSSNGEASSAAEPIDDTPLVNPLKWTVRIFSLTRC